MLNYCSFHINTVTIAAKQAKLEELERLVLENEEKHKQLNEEIQSKDTIIADLKKQLKHNERKFLEELKKKNQQVLALKVELDNKGSTIAYLTTEMHKIKIIHKSNAEALTRSSPSPPSGDQIPKHIPRPDVHTLHVNIDGLTDIPVSPPSGDQSTRRRPRRTSASDIRSRPVTAKGANKARPDAEVFLARAAPTEPEPDSVAVKPTPPVLPPITPGGEEVNKKSFSRRQQLLRRRVELKSQPEYGKLAVDKIASSSNTWVHEPNATTK